MDISYFECKHNGWPTGYCPENLPSEILGAEHTKDIGTGREHFADTERICKDYGKCFHPKLE